MRVRITRDVEQRRDHERRHDDDQAIERVVDAGDHLHGGEHLRRQRQRQTRRAPDQPHRVVEEQDQPEGRQHVIEMIAAVEMPERDEFQRNAEQQRGTQRQHDADDEIAGPRHEGRGEIGAHHVERAVRQVDEVHDAEDERQPRRQQEQQQAELDAVEALLDEIRASDFAAVPQSRGLSFGETRPRDLQGEVTAGCATRLRRSSSLPAAGRESRGVAASMDRP